MIKILFFLPIIVSVSNAESVVLFSTNFSELPEDWTNGSPFSAEWVFSSGGANAYGGTSYYEDESWDAIMHSPYGMYFVPDGADSVVVHMEHFLLLEGDPTGYGEIYLTTTTLGDIPLYLGYIIPYSGGFCDDQPMHWSSGPFPEGTWLGIYFWANLYTCSGMGNLIDWHIYSLTITAYGSDMAIDTNTWAAIKNSFN